MCAISHVVHDADSKTLTVDGTEWPHLCLSAAHNTGPCSTPAFTSYALLSPSVVLTSVCALARGHDCTSSQLRDNASTLLSRPTLPTPKRAISRHVLTTNTSHDGIYSFAFRPRRFAAARDSLGNVEVVVTLELQCQRPST